MIEVKQFDKIETKDGRLATVLFHKIGTDYALVEFDDDASDDTLLLEEIKKVIKENK